MSDRLTPEEQCYNCKHKFHNPGGCSHVDEYYGDGEFTKVNGEKSNLYRDPCKCNAEDYVARVAALHRDLAESQAKYEESERLRKEAEECLDAAEKRAVVAEEKLTERFKEYAEITFNIALKDLQASATLLPQLVAALRDILGLIDDETLVRSTKHDDHPGWGLRMVPVVRKLAKAKKILGLAEATMKGEKDV